MPPPRRESMAAEPVEIIDKKRVGNTSLSTCSREPFYSSLDFFNCKVIS
jgi:hypothetical protein